MRSDAMAQIRVKVNLVGPLASLLGTRELAVEPAGDTVGDVLESLAARYGARVREEFLAQDGSLGDAYMVLIGKQRVHSLALKVSDGDELLVIPPFAGGSLRQPFPLHSREREK